MQATYHVALKQTAQKAARQPTDRSAVQIKRRSFQYISEVLTRDV